jgi:metal-sulfur cluster biosynthetic enzyme
MRWRAQGYSADRTRSPEARRQQQFEATRHAWSCKINDAGVDIVYEPVWTPERMTEEARRELGML